RGLLHEVLHQAPFAGVIEVNRARLQSREALHFEPSTGFANANLSSVDLVGGPGFEPGASRSRTGLMSCPSVSQRLLPCPAVLDWRLGRDLACPPVSSWFRNCVTRL